jgi:hypothetical protein
MLCQSSTVQVTLLTPNSDTTTSALVEATLPLATVPATSSAQTILLVTAKTTSFESDPGGPISPFTSIVQTTLQTATLASVEPSSTAEVSTSIASQISVVHQSSTSLISTSLSTQSSTSLTTGAKAGIGVAAILGAALLMVLGALISWAARRQRRPKQDREGTGNSVMLDEPPTSEPPKLEHGPVELPSADAETRELSGKGAETNITRELDASGYSTNRRSRKELDGAHWRRELEGDTPKGTWRPTRS